MIEPVAWIGQDAFVALLGGETICQTMTPSQAMYDDVPLTVIPPGFAIVPVEPTAAMLQQAGDFDGTPDKLLRAIWATMVLAAKGE